MLLVVTGAGATYDSAPSKPANMSASEHRPPLADQLFEDRTEFVRIMQRLPRILTIVPYLQARSSGRSLERVLEELQSEVTAYEHRARQLAAVRYYLHVLLGECVPRWWELNARISNYKTLLDQIERWRKPSECVYFVTFNYDQFLEADLTSLGVGIQSLSDYTAHPNYKLVKLHGSVNWGHQITSGVGPLTNNSSWGMANTVIESAPSLKIDNEFHLVDERPMGRSGDTWYFPAIAIPVETKTSFECPPDHLKSLEAFLPSVTKILCIGWRGSESRFLNMLATGLKQPVEVLVVAEKAASTQETIQRLQTVGIAGTFAAYDAGFTSFVVSRAGDSLLRGAV